MRQGQHDGQFLLVAQRELVGAEAHRQIELERQQQGAPVVEVVVQGGHLAQMLGAVETAEQIGRLGHIAQTFTHLVAQIERGTAQQLRSAGLRHGQTDQTAQQAALARAIAADQAHHRALGQGKTDVVQHRAALQQARADGEGQVLRLCGDRSHRSFPFFACARHCLNKVTASLALKPSCTACAAAACKAGSSRSNRDVA